MPRRRAAALARPRTFSFTERVMFFMHTCYVRTDYVSTPRNEPTGLVRASEKQAAITGACFIIDAAW